jgi:hypothetical protein
VLEALLAVRLLAHVVARPQAPELLALHGQFPDQLRQTGVVGVPPGGEAQPTDCGAGVLIPVPVQLPRALIEEEMTGGVARLARKRPPITEERSGEPVPRQHVHAPADHHGR